MVKITKRLKNKLAFYKLKIACNKAYKYNKNDFHKKVAIVSNNKYKDKVIDDLLLKKRLYERGYDATIISWEETLNYKDFDIVIIRSIWGYQNKIKDFEDWLSFLKGNKINVVNNIDIMNNNYNKEKQFKILDKYNIKHIDTMFLPKNTKDLTKYINDKELVIKPSISGSGDNTFIINSNSTKNSIEISEINNKLSSINKETSLMIQPYIKEIENGEISLICINGKFEYAVKRFPSRFTRKNGVSLIDIELDEELENIIDKVNEIEEYKDYKYMRLDVVKTKDKYIIMELELIEPQLFFNKLENKKLNKVLDKLIDSLE